MVVINKPEKRDQVCTVCGKGGGGGSGNADLMLAVQSKNGAAFS